jgi:LysM repeat protein
MWTKSACVMLAWCILLVIVVTASVTGSAGQAQANIRIASNSNSNSNSTSSSSTGSGSGSGSGVAAAGPLGVAAVPAGRGPAGRYVVQPGDTLAGIAAGLGVRGGWPALYAVNRAV